MTMSSRGTDDLVVAFQRLTATAETFVNGAPKHKRLDADRSALLDAIAHAQLVLSVHLLPKDRHGEMSRRADRRRNQVDYEQQLRLSREKSKQLELRLGSLTAERQAIKDRINRAKRLLESVPE